MSTVYRKTAKGQAEIDTRVHRLLPRLRQALILVDGRRSDSELATLILADPAATLASLLADGFIEAIAILDDARTAERAAPPAVAPAAAVAPRKAASSDQLRRDAVRYLNDKLGPAAEGVAMKLERAKTSAEVRPLLAGAVQLLRSIHGAGAADEFAARFLGEETV